MKKKKGNPLVYENISDPKIETSVMVEMNHPTVKQSIWKKFYRVGSYKTSINESLSLEIGLKIIASGSSILYENLVNQQNIFCYWSYYQG